jgi:hypothetical protein
MHCRNGGPPSLTPVAVDRWPQAVRNHQPEPTDCSGNPACLHAVSKLDIARKSWLSTVDGEDRRRCSNRMLHDLRIGPCYR